jgi:hypothetical protein
VSLEHGLNTDSQDEGVMGDGNPSQAKADSSDRKNSSDDKISGNNLGAYNQSQPQKGYQIFEGQLSVSLFFQIMKPYP